MTPLSRATEPGLQVRLSSLAATLWPEVRSIDDLHRLPGGASREHWSFDAVCDAGTTPLVLRRARPEAADGLAAPSVEADLQRLARQAGVPAPDVRLVLRPENALGDGVVMARAPGEALAGWARQIAVARRCGQALARIHHVPIGALPPLRPGPATVEIARCLAQHGRLGGRPDAVDRAYAWLQRQAPGAPLKPALVHGDFRSANLRADASGLRAVLDWKFAHLGDPMEDLGWLCAATCGDSIDAAPGARETELRTELFAGYEDAGGRVDPERVHYWDVFGTLKRALVADAAPSLHDASQRLHRLLAH